MCPIGGVAILVLFRGKSAEVPFVRRKIGYFANVSERVKGFGYRFQSDDDRSRFDGFGDRSLD